MLEESKEAQVTSQLQVLNTYVEDAQAVLRTLHGRLDSVLLPQIPQMKEIGSNNAVEQSLVPMANEIRDIRYKVSEMISLTQGIINRLEL